MTLGEHVAKMTLKDVIEGKAQKVNTKRILRRCLIPLRTVIDEIAAKEAGKMALPQCYGRHIIMACPNRGMICDQMYWSDPVEELQSNDLADRAALWAELAAFVYQAKTGEALLTLATRLGKDGIAQFEASMSKLDQEMGTVVFRDNDTDISLTTRGVLIVLAGVESGASTGIVGALPLPVLTRPGSVADWHREDWTRDSNHRLLH